MASAATDDLISIFRDLGMEMTLFKFKCFVLAPGLLYLCLIPVHRQKHTLHGESAPAAMDLAKIPPFIVDTARCTPDNRQAACRERERGSI